MLKGIETVVYYVDDVAAAAAWYRKVLAIAPNFETPHYTGFTVAGYELGLHPSANDKTPTTKGPEMYWSVTDVQTAMRHFVENGARELVAPHEVGGGIWVGTVEDPFGNAFGFIQNPNSPNRDR